MANTLFDFYQGKGQQLPSVQERSKIFESSGLGAANTYRGTAQQNTALLKSLQTPTPKSAAEQFLADTKIPQVDIPKVTDANALRDTPKDFVAPDMTTPQQAQDLGIKNVMNAGASTADFYQNLLKQQQAPTQAETERSNLTEQLTTALEGVTGKGQALVDAQAELGIPESQKQLQDINLQIAQLTQGYDTNIEQLSAGTGLSTTIAGKQGQLQRQKAIEVGGLATVAQALQGNIALAKQTAQEIVDLKYADAEQEVANLKDLIDLNYQNMTAEQQKRADALSIQLQAREEEINNKKIEESRIFDIGLKVAENGNAEKARMVMESNNVEEALYNAGESLAQFAEDKLLSPTEAATLGVPYGTTQKEAAIQGAVPKAVLTPTDKIKQEFNMSKQVDTSTKDANNAKRQIGIMEAGYNEAVQAGLDGTSNNAPSQAVLITFQKLLDPTSVVRESEYARSGDGQSILQRMQGTYEKLLRGGAGVTQAELKNFYDLSQQLLKGYNDEQVNTLRRTRTQAENWGLNLSNIITPEAQTLLEQNDAKRLNEYYRSNPDKKKTIDRMIMDNPDISDYDILRVIGTGFNQDLSKSIKGTYPQGSYGGQCTTFLHGLAEFPSIGDSKSEKFNSVNKFGIKKKDWIPQVGDIIVTNESEEYGHTAMVTSIDEQGNLTLTESNYGQPERVSNTRQISYFSPSIYGAIRPTKLKI